jgi:lactoylglutathione lyase
VPGTLASQREPGTDLSTAPPITSHDSCTNSVGEESEQAMTDQHVHEFRVVLTVDDFERALAFYRDGVGLPVIQSWGGETGAGAILAAGGRATLELLSVASADRTDEIEAGRRLGTPLRIAFGVADSASSAETLVEAGATHVAGPVLTPWSTRSVRIEAPEGTQLTLFTPEA